MKSVKAKGSPIPVRFSEGEAEFVATAATATGLPNAEIIRRAVRFMREQQKASGNLSFVFTLAA